MPVLCAMPAKINVTNVQLLSGVLEEKIMEVIKVGRIKPESYKAPEFFRYKCRHCDAELLADGQTLYGEL